MLRIFGNLDINISYHYLISYYNICGLGRGRQGEVGKGKKLCPNIILKGFYKYVTNIILNENIGGLGRGRQGGVWRGTKRWHGSRWERHPLSTLHVISL